MTLEEAVFNLLPVDGSPVRWSVIRDTVYEGGVSWDGAPAYESQREQPVVRALRDLRKAGRVTVSDDGWARTVPASASGLLYPDGRYVLPSNAVLAVSGGQLERIELADIVEPGDSAIGIAIAEAEALTGIQVIRFELDKDDAYTIHIWATSTSPAQESDPR